MEEFEDEDEGFEEEAPAGAPLWITTFADLMSLLMCFFVMLLTMSTIEMTTYKKMIQSMQVGFGLAEATTFSDDGPETKVLSAEDRAKVLREAGRQRTREAATELRDKLKGEITKGTIEVEAEGQTVTIQVMQSISFDGGSANLKAAFTPIANSIRDTLHSIKGHITVAGHTDDIPIRSKRFRSNWELSSARAFSVIFLLQQGDVINSDRFILRGYSATQPRYPNDSPENRAKNRRVEIILDQRETHLSDDEDNPDKIVIDSTSVDSIDTVLDETNAPRSPPRAAPKAPPKASPKPP